MRKCPEALFSEQKRTVNTSIFGFTKTPHKKSDSVLFYDLSDDGFVSIQHKGRVDKNQTWDKLESEIVETISNGIEINDVSQKRKIYNKDGLLNCYGIREKKDSKYEMVKIDELFELIPGTLPSENNNDSGEYNFITAAAEWKKHDSFTHDCEAIVMAISASGSLGRTHYVKGKFTAANLCTLLIPKRDSGYEINLKFYNFYFNAIRKQLRNDLADGSSKLTIRPDDLREYYIEYIPKAEQDEFYENNIKSFEKLQKKVLSAQNKLNDNLTNMLN